MAAYRRVDDLRSPAGSLAVHRDQLRAQRSVSSMGNLYLFYLTYQQPRWQHPTPVPVNQLWTGMRLSASEQRLLSHVTHFGDEECVWSVTKAVVPCQNKIILEAF